MSMESTNLPNLTLCGVSFDFEQQYMADKVAASRIHRCTKSLEEGLKSYPDLADTLAMMDRAAEDAGRIIEALNKSGGIGHDKDHKVIEDVVVIKELRILSADLNKIATATSEFFNSEKGKKATGGIDEVQIHSRKLSISKTIEDLQTKAKDLADKADRQEKGDYSAKKVDE